MNAIVDPNPVYFPGRLILDLTEGAAFPIFGHNLCQAAQKKELILFGTAQKEAASDAGFDASTVLPEGWTNITKKGEIPGGGAMKVKGISMIFQHLKKPASVASALAVSKIEAGSHYHTGDYADGKVFSHALRLVDAAFKPFFQHGTSGRKTYLPSVSHLASSRGIRDGRIATVEGPIYTFPDGAEPMWSKEGLNSNLLFGLQLVADQYNAPWAIDGGAGATAPGTTIRSSLGYTAAAAAPGAAGVVIGVLDFTVFLYGQRVARSGD